MTIVALCLCAFTAVFVLFYRRNPVIRATTPSLCVVIILGAALMLTSNFFATLTLDDEHCAASVWLLTIGFTCVFGSLFLRSTRIWHIWRANSLQPAPLKHKHILSGVAALVAVDVIINAIWQGTGGMSSELIQPDPYRPSKNYRVCHYGPSLAAVWVHLAIKGALMLIGMVLTWVLRKVPSRFNETTTLALSIYNTSFLVCFILPIVALGLGGREATMLIRAFAIIFCALTTLLLLFAPKVRLIMSNASKTSKQTPNKLPANGAPATPQVAEVKKSDGFGPSIQMAGSPQAVGGAHGKHTGNGAAVIGGETGASPVPIHGVDVAPQHRYEATNAGASAIPGHLPVSHLPKISSFQLAPGAGDSGFDAIPGGEGGEGGEGRQGQIMQNGLTRKQQHGGGGAAPESAIAIPKFGDDAVDMQERTKAEVSYNKRLRAGFLPSRRADLLSASLSALSVPPFRPRLVQRDLSPSTPLSLLSSSSPRAHHRAARDPGSIRREPDRLTGADPSQHGLQPTGLADQRTSE